MGRSTARSKLPTRASDKPRRSPTAPRMLAKLVTGANRFVVASHVVVALVMHPSNRRGARMNTSVLALCCTSVRTRSHCYVSQAVPQGPSASCHHEVTSTCTVSIWLWPILRGAAPHRLKCHSERKAARQTGLLPKNSAASWLQRSDH